MPCSNKEKQKELQHEWYLRNKGTVLPKVHQNTRNHKEKLRRIVNERRKIGCSLCGYNKCLSAIEFHHVFGDKDLSIHNMLARGRSVKDLLEELDKCIVVCANCHREIHDEMKWIRSED